MLALGTSIVVEQTMKAPDYLNVTEKQLHPYMASVFPTENGIIQKVISQAIRLEM